MAPQDLIDYYLRVEAQQHGSSAQQLAKTQQYFRLFMVPGMYHCAFGPGPNAFGNRFSGEVYAATPPASSDDAQLRYIIIVFGGDDAGRRNPLLDPLFERHQRVVSCVVMQRPICPFPQVPKYNGSGDTNAAASFSCVTDTNTNNQMAAPEYLN